MKQIVFLVAVLFANFLNGGTIDPNIDDKVYIKYGNDHECIFKVRCEANRDKEKRVQYFASCVLIKPSIAITAAHVIFESDLTFVINGDKEIAADLVFYPAVFEEDVGNEIISPNDIAILHLSEPIEIGFYPELYDNDDEVGKICSISGFGYSGTHSAGIFRGDGKKRAGSNYINKIDEGMLECSLSDPNKTSLEFLIAVGDSGGGLFIDQKLAGINSCIYTSHRDKKLNSDYNDSSLHTRISKHKDWINKMILLIEDTIEKENK